MARVRELGGETVTPLDAGWMLSLAGAAEIPASVPGTVASALQAQRLWDVDARRDFDLEEAVYRVHFPRPAGDGEVSLRFEGLATRVTVTLNGDVILESASMFLAHEVLLGAALKDENALVLTFHPLQATPVPRSPRPRWKTRLVESPALRFIRTTFLGRMPGWNPLAAPVGPYRPVSLVQRTRVEVLEADVRAGLDGDDRGTLEARLCLRLLGGGTVEKAELVVAGRRSPLKIQTDGAKVTLEGALTLEQISPWWPHTHGTPTQYPVALELELGGVPLALALGPVGFRSLAFREEPGLGVRVNGIPVFCRGAVWTTADIVSLESTEAGLRPWLTTLRDSGMNMVRVGGTMAYESDAFFSLCDELGILVWQDFMFANFDYPVADAEFLASVEAEARQLLARTQLNASLTVLCGGSEVEQQAAMFGAPRSLWQGPLFTQTLPGLVRGARPEVAYLTSSPTGGDLPFSVDRGVGHYYGVGAYLRPLEDARRAQVSFASECLAFAHVPGPAMTDALAAAPGHHPRWKARVPRDNGAGWDFEDTRDHYVALLFGVDPARLRAADPERYLALGRVATGEVMAAVFSEWRRAESSCGGGLVWNFQDVWAGAGFGLVDSTGTPKAALEIAKRTLAPRMVLLTDEGVNGLEVHVTNEDPSPLRARVRVTLYREGRVELVTGQRALTVAPRGLEHFNAASLFDHFFDVTYAYRFGPPSHDVTAVVLESEQGQVLGRAFHFPLGFSRAPAEVLIASTLEAGADGAWTLTLTAEGFAQHCFVEAAGYRAEENHFHLESGRPHSVQLLPLARGAAPPRGTLQPLNTSRTTRFQGV